MGKKFENLLPNWWINKSSIGFDWGTIRSKKLSIFRLGNRDDWVSQLFRLLDKVLDIFLVKMKRVLNMI